MKTLKKNLFQIVKVLFVFALIIFLNFSNIGSGLFIQNAKAQIQSSVNSSESNLILGPALTRYQPTSISQESSSDTLSSQLSRGLSQDSNSDTQEKSNLNTTDSFDPNATPYFLTAVVPPTSSTTMTVGNHWYNAITVSLLSISDSLISSTIITASNQGPIIYDSTVSSYLKISASGSNDFRYWTLAQIPFLKSDGEYSNEAASLIYFPDMRYFTTDSSGTTAGDNFFRGFNYLGSLTSLPEGSFDTSSITSAGSCFFCGFNYQGSLTSLPEGSFNISSITNVGSSFFLHFNNDGLLTSLPAGSFNTSSIASTGTSFFDYFNFYGRLTSLPENSFNISSITSVGNYFFEAFNYHGRLTSLPENSFNISSITSVGNYFFDYFDDTGSLTSLPYGSFDTSNITSYGTDFFKNFAPNAPLDRSNVGVSIKNVTNYNVTFYWNNSGGSEAISSGSTFCCYASGPPHFITETIPASENATTVTVKNRWTTTLTINVQAADDSVTIASYEITSSTGQTTIPLTPNEDVYLSIYPSSVDGFRGWQENVLNPFVTASGESASQASSFVHIPSMNYFTEDSTGTKAPKGFFQYFFAGSPATSLPAGSFDTSSLTTVSESFFTGFAFSASLTSLPDGSFNTSSITSASHHFFSYFGYNSSLASLPDGSFNTSNLPSAGYFFFYAFAYNAPLAKSTTGVSIKNVTSEVLAFYWSSNTGSQSVGSSQTFCCYTTVPPAPTFTLSFDSNGGSPVDNSITIQGEAFPRPPNPVRSTYQFVQWVDDGGNPYDWNSTASADLTLTAQWAPYFQTQNIPASDVTTITINNRWSSTLTVDVLSADSDETLTTYTVNSGANSISFTYTPTQSVYIVIYPSDENGFRNWVNSDSGFILTSGSSSSQAGSLVHIPDMNFFTTETSGTEAGDYFFKNFFANTNATSLPAGSFDTSNITTAGNYFFSGFNLSGKLTQLPVDSFNISSITDATTVSFFESFNRSGSLTSLPAGSFDTSNITVVDAGFFYAFNGYGKLTSLPDNSFDTSNITSASHYFFREFNNYGSLTALPANSFNTSKITTVGAQFFFYFNRFGKLTFLPVSSFDISSITSAPSSFFYSFNYGGSLTALPENSFNTSNITTVGSEFFGGFNCNGSLTSLPENSFDISGITYAEYGFFTAFNSGGKLTSLPENSFNTSNITSDGGMFFNEFNNSGSLTSLPAGSFNISNMTSAGFMFFYIFNSGGSLTSLPYGSFDTSNIASANFYFFQNFNQWGGITRNTSSGISIKNPYSSSVTFYYSPGNTSSVVSSGGTFSYYNADAPVTLTLTLDLNGGESTDTTVTAFQGSKFIKPENPTKSGYMFTGWLDEAGNPYNWNSTATADLTLTAKWEVPPYFQTKTIPSFAGATTYTIQNHWDSTITIEVIKNSVTASFYTLAGDTSTQLPITQDAAHYLVITPSSLSTFRNWVNTSTAFIVTSGDSASLGASFEHIPDMRYFTTDSSGTQAGNYFFKNFFTNTKPTSLPPGSFDTSSITTVGDYFFYRFNYSGSLTSLPVNSFNTSNITTAGNGFFESFNQYGSLTSFPKFSFNFDSLLTYGAAAFYAFNQDGSLTSLPYDSFKFKNYVDTAPTDNSWINFNNGGLLTKNDDWGISIKNTSADSVTFYWAGPTANTGSIEVAIGSSFQYYTSDDPDTFTITFDSNGGSPVDNSVTIQGEAFPRPENPEKFEHKFIDWLDEAGNPYNWDASATADLTLTAQWEPFKFVNSLSPNLGRVGVAGQTTTVYGSSLLGDKYGIKYFLNETDFPTASIYEQISKADDSTVTFTVPKVNQDLTYSVGIYYDDELLDGWFTYDYLYNYNPDNPDYPDNPFADLTQSYYAISPNKGNLDGTDSIGLLGNFPGAANSTTRYSAEMVAVKDGVSPTDTVALTVSIKPDGTISAYAPTWTADDTMSVNLYYDGFFIGSQTYDYLYNYNPDNPVNPNNPFADLTQSYYAISPNKGNVDGTASIGLLGNFPGAANSTTRYSAEMVPVRADAGSGDVVALTVSIKSDGSISANAPTWTKDETVSVNLYYDGYFIGSQTYDYLAGYNPDNPDNPFADLTQSYYAISPNKGNVDGTASIGLLGNFPGASYGATKYSAEMVPIKGTVSSSDTVTLTVSIKSDGTISTNAPTWTRDETVSVNLYYDGYFIGSHTYDYLAGYNPDNPDYPDNPFADLTQSYYEVSPNKGNVDGTASIGLLGNFPGASYSSTKYTAEMVPVKGSVTSGDIVALTVSIKPDGTISTNAPTWSQDETVSVNLYYDGYFIGSQPFQYLVDISTMEYSSLTPTAIHVSGALLSIISDSGSFAGTDWTVSFIGPNYAGSTTYKSASATVDNSNGTISVTAPTWDTDTTVSVLLYYKGSYFGSKNLSYTFSPLNNGPDFNYSSLNPALIRLDTAGPSATLFNKFPQVSNVDDITVSLINPNNSSTIALTVSSYLPGTSDGKIITNSLPSYSNETTASVILYYRGTQVGIHTFSYTNNDLTEFNSVTPNVGSVSGTTPVVLNGIFDPERSYTLTIKSGTNSKTITLGTPGASTISFNTSIPEWFKNSSGTWLDETVELILSSPSGSSKTQTFNYNLTSQTINSLSPDHSPYNITSITATLSGLNLGTANSSNLRLNFGSQSIPIISYSSSQVTFKVPTVNVSGTHVVTLSYKGQLIPTSQTFTYAGTYVLKTTVDRTGNNSYDKDFQNSINTTFTFSGFTNPKLVLKYSSPFTASLFSGTYTQKGSGIFSGTYQIPNNNIRFILAGKYVVSATIYDNSKSFATVSETFTIPIVDPDKVSYNKIKDISKLTTARQNDIKWLNSVQITGGCSSESKNGSTTIAYCPNDPVNRGSMAMFFQKLAGNYATPKSTASVPGYGIIADVKVDPNPNDSTTKFSVTYSGAKKATKVSYLSAQRVGAIVWMFKAGLTGGAGKDSKGNIVYKAQDPVNRGSMASFIMNLASVEAKTISKTSFPDVKVDPKPNDKINSFTITYKGAKKGTKVDYVSAKRAYAIKWLSDNQITMGSGNDKNGKTTFRPQDVVNRGSMAQFMHRAAYLIGSTSVKPANDK